MLYKAMPAVTEEALVGSSKTIWCLKFLVIVIFSFMTKVCIVVLVAIVKTPTASGPVRGSDARPTGTSNDAVVQGGSTMTTLYPSVSQQQQQKAGIGPLLGPSLVANTMAPASSKARLRQSSKTKATVVPTTSSSGIGATVKPNPHGR